LKMWAQITDMMRDSLGNYKNGLFGCVSFWQVELLC